MTLNYELFPIWVPIWLKKKNLGTSSQSNFNLSYLEPLKHNTHILGKDDGQWQFVSIVKSLIKFMYLISRGTVTGQTKD